MPQFIDRDTMYHYLEQLLDCVNKHIYLVDEDYCIIYCNEKARLNVFNGNNVVGESLFTVFPELKHEESYIVKTFVSGKPSSNNVVKYVTADRKYCTAMASFQPFWRDGKVTAVAEIFDDITNISNLSVPANKRGPRFSGKTLNRPSGSEARRFYYNVNSIIGVSESTKVLHEQISLFAASKANVMICGETGTGKEIVAQSIFSLTMDTDKVPFIAQNCAAIPESLLESILFGTEKGTFTGAETRPGLFELASGGILFLDEVNSMSLPLQAKVLRVLEERKVRRIGARSETSVSFRLISSTNVPPESLVSTGDLRKDLFYRLNVLQINIPPLRERQSDIPVLLHYYLDYFNFILEKNIAGFDHGAMEILLNHAWPGNVRELKNVVERSAHLTSENLITKETLQIEPETRKNTSTRHFQASPESRVRLKEAVRELEISIICDALSAAKGNVSKAARELDLPQQTLYGKLERYGLKELVITHNPK